MIRLVDAHNSAELSKMKCWCFAVVLLVFDSGLGSPVTDQSSLVVSTTTEAVKEGQNEDNKVVDVNPQIYSMQVSANVSNRFARTLIASKVRNLKGTAEETTFSVILPENAFISEFEMEINDKVYKAYVKEKEEAKQIYQDAVASGQSAAHVELSARDSKTFTVSVNIEPEGKTIFRLVYEELLQRQLGQYELVINIHPGQTVDDLGVQVHINETRPLKFVRTPSLRTGNEISKNDDKLDPSADIQFEDNKTATVRFHPDVTQQKEFAKNLGGDKDNGLAGQFVVQYDVERDPQGGEVLVKDGYFVHFFAPIDLQPLPKHVVFVLDHSGSMAGRKIEQLIEAMENILSDLRSDDLFNIVRFADQASVWDAESNQFVPVKEGDAEPGHLESQLREANLSQAIPATKANIDKAKAAVKDKSDMGLTNIISGLEVGLFLTKKTQEKHPDKYQPMIVFLTDGFANVGLSSGDDITGAVTKINTQQAALFSLSFGDGADKDFLRKLSSQNLGFSRHIYEGADASLQLQDFYKTISSPLLSNITFNYVDTVSQVTKQHYPILFNGSELVVAGRTGQDADILPEVGATCLTGPILLNTTRTEPVSSLERLWAYLTVKQILDESDVAANNTELKKKALDLALKYSFVTKVSSLVVVKPNGTSSVDTNNAANREGDDYSYAAQSLNAPVVGPQVYRSYALSSISGSSYAAPAANWGPVLTSNKFAPTFYQTTTESFSLQPVISESDSAPKAPEWLEDLRQQGGNITTPQGSFKLGQEGEVVTKPKCPKTPLNATGVCTIILDCPQVFSLLTDINVYLQYFCPLNEFAGVCCPPN